MSAFMVSNHLMQKVVTAILQNTDEFATIQTFRGRSANRCAVQSCPGNRQAAVLDERCGDQSRYGIFPQRPVFKFAGWRDATPVEQFKAIRCLLYQSCEAPWSAVGSTAN